MDKYLKALTYILFILLSFSLPASEVDKLYEKARSALNDNNHNAALIHVKNIMKKMPNHLAAHVLMAEILLSKGNAVAAEIALTQATNLGADEQQLQLLFAKSYIMQRKYSKTLDYLPEQTNDDKLASKIYVLRGDAHLGLRQLKRSQNDYYTALAFNDKSIDAKLGLAQVSVNYFQYRKANNFVDEVLAGYVPPIKAWNLKASIQQSLGNNELALNAVNQALLIDRNNIQSLIFASSINFELQHFNIAEQYADTVLDQIPNEPKAEFLKAMLEMRKKKSLGLESSIEKVAQVLNHLTKDVLNANPSYYYLASMVLFQQQKYEAARQYIDAYLFIDEYNINALTLAATINLVEKKSIQAKAFLTKANLLEPDNPKILFMLGMSYFELKQFSKAQYYFAKVKELKPNSGIADTQLAQSFLATGEPQKAINHLLMASASEYDSTIVGLLLVESYIKSGEMKKGINVAEKLAKSMQRNANIQHHLGYIYQISGEIQKAKKQFEQALEIEPNHIKSEVSLARIDYMNGKKDVAINRLLLALRKKPDDIYLITTLSKLYNITKNSAASVILLEEKFSFDNENEELLKSLVRSYVGDKQLVVAIETLRTYLLNHSKTVELYLLLANLHIRNSDMNAAIKAYKSAIREGGDQGQIFRLIAIVYQRFSKVPEAIAAYKKVMVWDDGNEQVIKELAQLYNDDNDTVSAIELIKVYETNHQLSAQLIEVLANSYFGTKQYGLAEEYYNKRIQLKSNDSSVVGLHLVYKATKRINKAIDKLTTSLNENPNSLLLNAALAEVYIEQSQWLKANKIYTGLVKRHPDYPVILNNASFVALNLSDYQRAEALIKKSLAIVDNHPDSLDTLGWIYYHTKKYNEALPLFRKALAINNSNSAVKYHLSLTLKALNRDKEAIKLMVDVVNSDYAQKSDADRILKQWVK